jgi:serine/threonine-protein kinase HipA
MKRIEVFYRDRKAGELAASGNQTSLQFAPDFIQSGIQLSPLRMKLRPEPYIYGEADFGCLPPLLSDSLPDSYGRAVMNRWFAAKFGAEYRPTPLDKLAYVGMGGIGALSYRPVLDAFPPEVLREMDLREEQRLAAAAIGQQPLEKLEKLRRAVHTVGGRFPKALLAIDPGTGLVYEDDPRLDPRFERWIVKFGIPAAERDNLLNYPEVEYAYSCMARDVGIRVPRTRLLTTRSKEGNLVHFAIERFDVVDGTRLHVASLSGLTEIPAGRLELDYRDLFSVALDLCRDLREVREAFLRMLFNIAMHNVDDHGKNHAFVFDGSGWKLAPAFDLTFSDVSAPNEHTYAARAMPVNGNPLNPRRKDLLNLGERFGLRRGDCDAMMDQVAKMAARTREYLGKSGMPAVHLEAVASAVDRSLNESFR